MSSVQTTRRRQVEINNNSPMHSLLQVQPSMKKIAFAPKGGKRSTARRASRHARRTHGRRYRSRHTRR